MTSLLPSQRAAEDFEKVLSGTASPAVAERYAGLVETVVALRSQPDVLPRADFVDDLRSRLMTAAATELVAAPPARRAEPSRPGTRRRRAGTVAAALVIVGGTAGMAAAAQGAMPGESLYPIKRGIEKAGVALRLDDAGQGRRPCSTRPRPASRRCVRSRPQGSADPDLVASTLDSFSEAADTGSEYLFSSYQSEGTPEDITAVRSFTATSMPQVVAISRPGHRPPPTSSCATRPTPSPTSTSRPGSSAAPAARPAPSHHPRRWPPAPARPPSATCSPVRSPQAQVRHRRCRGARIARLQAARPEVGRRAHPRRAPAGLAGADSPARATPVTSTLTRDGTLVPAAVAQGSHGRQGPGRRSHRDRPERDRSTRRSRRQGDRHQEAPRPGGRGARATLSTA